MKNSFLEYYKMILKKVSFDKELFNKEYKKALDTIGAEQVDEFQQWMSSNGFK